MPPTREIGWSRWRFGKTVIVEGMVVRGHAVTTEMQSMILGTYKQRCPRASIGMWLHYWTGWSIRDSDCIVDSVICRCFKPDTEDDE